MVPSKPSDRRLSRRLIIVLVILLFLVVPLSSIETTDNGDTKEVCEISAETGESTCRSTPSKEEQQSPQKINAVFINKSKYRVDLYFDDGRFGSRIAVLEIGQEQPVNTVIGHSFFITRHGTREALYDSQTDLPFRFAITSTTDSNIFLIPKTAGPSTNPCQDRYSICPEEANTRDGCWTNPGWMIVNCCQSCDAHMQSSILIDRSVRCTKERLNITTPAWQPGDLDQLFTQWATDAQYANLKPVIWSSPRPNEFKNANSEGHIIQEGPWVMTFDNFLSDEEADALIRGGQLEGFQRSTDQGATNALGEREKIVSKSRTSSNAWCGKKCETMPEIKTVTQRIQDVTNIPQTNYEQFQILEYEVNQFYKMHHDSSGNKDKSPSGHRILTFFLYLSDVEEGGATKFNKLGIEIQPKKGRAVVWPSVTNEDPTKSDPRMYHEAMPVIKGKKYAANHWIHLNDYRGPNLWGCTGSFS